MRILVVEDDPTSSEILEHFLEELGFDVDTADNGIDAYEMVIEEDYRMVISDWHMPEMNGLELCQFIRRRNFGSYVYVILLTCEDGTESLIQGLNAGADDFLTKPFRPEELQVRLHAGERIASLESRDLIIFSMAKLAESRDPDTGSHLERMREYVRILAEELSHDRKYSEFIDADYVRTLYLTSPLHDIGKVGIPDSVLLKPGRLTEEEFEVMKMHASIGAKTLEAALEVNPSADFLRLARDIALTHHEKYDGSGYPKGLAGDQIPLCGRIVALADVYDALTTKRIYKPAFSHEEAKSIILGEMEMAFDPDIVVAFLNRQEDFLEVRQMFDEDKMLVGAKADSRF